MIAIISRFAAVVALFVTATGCVAGRGATGIGFVQVDEQSADPRVAYRHIHGFGAVSYRGMIGVGLIDWQFVEVELDRGDVRVQTPLAQIATGDEADRWAEHFAREILDQGSER